MWRCSLLRRHLAASAALSAGATASSLGDRRGQGPGATPRLGASCEVRLWGPGGTRGRSAAEIAKEAEAASKPCWLPTTLAEEAGGLARQGPLYAKLAQPPFDEEWARLGAVLVERLTGPKGAADLPLSAIDPQVVRRIYHTYLPIYFWMRQQLVDIECTRLSRGDSEKRAVVFGISAPQGCGKTTMVELLKALFILDGMSCQALSIDDFYLPASGQQAVAELHHSNSLVQTRGNAGTHEVSLGERTLQALSRSREGEVQLPRYNKSANRGRGDRAPSQSWDTAQMPCDVVLLEGWMLGFKARADSAALARIHTGLPLVNEKLQKYQAWDDFIDAWCVVGVEDIKQVYGWRLQAEHAMKESGKGPGMSDEEVRCFVDKYMPAYSAYRDTLYAAASGEGVDKKPSLLFHVGGDRNPVSNE
ncbi:unnamed protein product [Polarella glacialis]|uniref:Uncharacterized protein n=1 Tax=Polarella glacialis TaxID=89957 RepID=A0A813H8C8_POLGL|nr:unnamed protein product [Polarella glacialis]